MSSQNGPYLSIAAICERVLQERDGVLSLIRIFDRWTVQGPFSRMPVSIIQLSAVVSLKGGGYRGQVRVSLRPRSPSGGELQRFEAPVVELNGSSADEGANVVVNLAFSAEEAGIYWFEIFLDDRMVTKIPLNVIYVRAEATSR